MTKNSPPRIFPNGSNIRLLPLLCCLFILSNAARGQQHLIRSLKSTLHSGQVKDSTQYTDLLNRISALSLVHQLDSTYIYAEQAKALALSIRYHKGLADACI